MKLLVMMLSILSVLVYANEEGEGGFSKKGFLTTEKCALKGEFRDCYLENYACNGNNCFEKVAPAVNENTPLVLYVHDEGKIYQLDTSDVPRSEMDEGVSRNEVELSGEYDPSQNIIVVKHFSPPPPPKKSFFKGCL